MAAAFPDHLRRRPDGGLGRRGTLRLASEALVDRLQAAGVALAVQGNVPPARAILAALRAIPPERLKGLGLDLPPPPDGLVANATTAGLGVDLVAADAVADTLWESGLEFLATGRWLYLDCGCGHALRGLQLALPGGDWLGLDRTEQAVTWAGRHVPTARFALQPARPPLAEPDGSIDGVVALALDDLGDRAAIEAWVAEIGRLVRPGGVAVLAVRGFGVLAELAEQRRVPAAEIADAYRVLAAGGNATVRAEGPALSLFSPDGLSLHGLGRGWSVLPARVAAAPGRKDIHVLRRRTTGETPAAEPLDVDGVVDAIDLVTNRRQGGLIGATRIVSAATVARRPPVFIDSASVAAPARRLHAMVTTSDRCTIPERHLLRLRDGLVTGQGAVVVRDPAGHRLLHDSVYEFLAFGSLPTGLTGNASERRFALPAGIDRRLAGCSLLLQRPWARNFGHWLIDHAMTLSFLAHMGALPTRQIVVEKVRKRGLRQIMRQTIAAILPDAVVHEHDMRETWAFEELAYVMPLHVPAILKESAAHPLRRPLAALAALTRAGAPGLPRSEADAVLGSFKLPAAMDCLRDDLLGPAASAGGARRRRRLHVLRPAAFARALVNEPEIVALTARYGFETVTPETLSMREQAALFASAEAVIGVKGAALTNIVFAPPSCGVIVLSPSDFIDAFFWDIASVRGLGYSEIFGPLTATGNPVGRNPFAVSPSSVEAALQRHLAG